MASPFLAMMSRPFMRRRISRKLDIVEAEGIRDERFVTIGGIPQWVSIRGRNSGNPVLLILHGGPGSPYTPLAPWLLEWEKSFTIVQWDQRGGGMTFKRNGKGGTGILTFDRLASDGIELASHLLHSLGKKKIILLGSSLGSLIGLIMIKRRPDLFWAYVGAEQNAPGGNIETHRLTLAAARRIGDRKGVRALESMGDDPNRWTRGQVELMNKLAIKASTDVPDMVYDIMLPGLMFWPGYTMGDISVIQKGMEYSQEKLFDERMSFDIRGLGFEVALPFFIFQGEGDILTPVSSAKAYFERIVALHKEFVLIPHAGHLAEFCNPARFYQELIQIVGPFVDER